MTFRSKVDFTRKKRFILKKKIKKVNTPLKTSRKNDGIRNLHVSSLNMEKITARSQTPYSIYRNTKNDPKTELYPEHYDTHKKNPHFVNIDKQQPRRSSKKLITRHDYEPKYDLVFPRPHSGNYV